MMQKLTTFSLTAALALLLAGCNSTPHQPMPDDPFYAPVLPEDRNEPVVPNGSLFQAQYADELYSDIKARRLGDIITVMLQEQTTASKSAATDTNKSSNAELATPQIFGRDISIQGNPLSANFGGERDFNAEGGADQSNSLSGQITVTVIKVLPNGNLIVRGEKWMKINTGDEYIRLTGMLRPEDISSDNMVPSTRVANARIEYSGTGSLAQVQEPGWLTRFFNSSYWPF